MRLLKGWLNPKLNSEISPIPRNCSWKPVKDLLHRPCQRSQHAVCMSSSFLYLYGGRGPYGCLNDLWKYHIEKQSWSLVDITNCDDKPSSLEGHTLVVYNENLYLFGGETSFASAHEVPLWRFSLKTLQWKKLTSEYSTPVGRREHVAIIHDGKMLIHGGYIDLKGPTDELWSYDVTRNSWKMLQSLNNVYPAARYKHAGVVYRDVLWISGGLMGVTDRNETQVWTWNLTSFFWTPIKLRGAPSQLFNHASCVAGDEVFIFGGNQEKGEVCSKLWHAKMSELISKRTQTWRACQFDDKIYPSPSCSHCMVILPPAKWFPSPAIPHVIPDEILNEKPYKKSTYQPISSTKTQSENDIANFLLSKEATAKDACLQSVYDVTNDRHLCSQKNIVYYQDTELLLDDQIIDDNSSIVDSDGNADSILSNDRSNSPATIGSREKSYNFNDTEPLLDNEIVDDDFSLFDLDRNSDAILSSNLGGGDVKVNSKENCLQSLDQSESNVIPASKRLPYKYNGYTNKSYTNSSQMFENQAVTRFSYNLSNSKQPWQPIRKKKEKKVYETTSFIDLSTDASASIRFEEKLKSVEEDKNTFVTFSKTQSKEQLTLPIPFYENSKKLLELESSFNKPDTVQKYEDSPATLLLLGGSSRTFNFHTKEPIHMWRCSLRLNESTN